MSECGRCDTRVVQVHVIVYYRHKVHTTLPILCILLNTKYLEPGRRGMGGGGRSLKGEWLCYCRNVTKWRKWSLDSLLFGELSWDENALQVTQRLCITSQNQPLQVCSCICFEKLQNVSPSWFRGSGTCRNSSCSRLFFSAAPIAGPVIPEAQTSRLQTAFLAAYVYVSRQLADGFFVFVMSRARRATPWTHTACSVTLLMTSH